MSNNPASFASGDAERVVDRISPIVAAYVDRLNDGERIDPLEVVAKHPQDGEQILERLEAFVAFAGPDDNQPLGTLGDYTLHRQIGRGGMGVVYEAWENSMDRAVALKVLPAGVTADDRAFQRFMQEAKTAGKLSHQNVVPVYSTGVKEGTPWYSMELVEGETLAQILARIKDADPETETPFGPKDQVDYFAKLARAFADVADGLQHAHSKGVTHRDIKPSNLILDAEGRLRILDFGLARVEGQESLTLSGDFVGTPLYMSPEQARRKKIPVDHRTDVYSLGATMYEAICGRPPFRGKDHADTLSQIIERDPVEPRKVNQRVPKDLETIVLKCLRKESGDRYGTAEALGQDLRRFVRGDPIEARPESTVERVTRWARRRAAAIAIGAAAAALLATIVVLLLVQRANEDELEAARRLSAEEKYRELVTGAVLRLEEALGSSGTVVFPGAGFVQFVPRHDALDPDRGTDGRRAFEQALAILEKARQILPDRPDALYHLGRAELARGDTRAAAATAARLRSRFPDFVPALILESGSTSEVEIFRVPASAPAEGWQTNWIAAHEALRRKEWSKAAEAFDLLLLQFGAGEEPYVGASVEAWLGKGKTHLAAKSWDAAVEDFAAARGLWPAAAEPALLLANAYHSRGNGSAAERVCEAQYHRSPVKADFAARVARIFLALGDVRRTRAWLPRVVDRSERQNLELDLLHSEGNWEAAIALCDEVLAERPDSPLASSTKAWVSLNGLGDPREAYRVATTALELAPENHSLRFCLAWAVYYLSDLPQARVMFESELQRVEQEVGGAATSRFVELAELHNSLGWTAWRQGALTEALRAHKVASETDPYSPYPWYGLTALHQELRQPSEALRCCAMGLMRRPGHFGLFQALLEQCSPGGASSLAPYWQPLSTATRNAIECGRSPPSTRALLALASLEDPSSRDGERALEEARVAARISPAHWSLALLGRAQWERGDRAEAVRNLERAVAKPKATLAEQSWLEKFRRGLLPVVASLESVDWYLEHAATSAEDLPSERAVEVAVERAGNTQAPQILAYLRARKTINIGDAEGAAQALEALLSPGSPEGEEAAVLVRWVDAMSMIGRTESAELRLRQALAGDLSSSQAVWQRWLGLNLVELHRGPETIVATAPSARSSGYASDLLWVFETLSSSGAVRLNCSGPDFIDAQGQSWNRDRFFTGGQRTTTWQPDIDGTADDSLYHTQRSFRPTEIHRGYEIPVPPGTYRVVLHFAEIHLAEPPEWKGPPRHSFDVRVEGRLAIENVSPSKEGFARAFTREVSVQVADALLEIDFVPDTYWPMVAGIELLQPD